MPSTPPEANTRTRLFVASFRASLDELLSRDLLARRIQALVLASIIVSTLVVRLDRIGAPAIDRTQWKEIDYLMISQGYWLGGFRFLEPEVWWPADEPRTTAMELPLVPFASALLYSSFGIEALTARATTLISFLALAGYVFMLVRRELGSTAGVLAAIVAATAGLRHPFGHLQLSEPPMLVCSVAAIHHMARWMDLGLRRDAIVSCLAFSLAVALKLEPLYLGLPLAYLVWRRFGATTAAVTRLAAYVAIALVLPALWFLHAHWLATHSIDVFGVFGGSLGTGHDKFQTLTMLSDVSWHREMISRLHEHLLGGRGEMILAAFGAGVLAWFRKGGLILVYLATIGLYFAIVAEGHLDAPYRQLASIPPLAGCVAAGCLGVVSAGKALASAVRKQGPRRCSWLAAAIAVALLVSLDLGTPLPDPDADRPAHPNAWVFAREIRKHARPGDRLVAAGEYTIHEGGNDLSPVLYYYAGLRGWTLQAPDWRRAKVDELIERGATLFAAHSMTREPGSADFIAEMKASFPVLFEDENGRILLRLRVAASTADGQDRELPSSHRGGEAAHRLGEGERPALRLRQARETEKSG